VVLMGDLTDGAWKTYETLLGPADLTFDADSMTCLAVACERSEAGRWTQAVADAMRHPEAIRAY
jgi:hypothetical protein